MAEKYREYGKLDLPNVAQEVLAKWKQEGTFEKSISSRPEDKNYVFFEGPPSANGLPGIHHVMARAIKDIFCRYKTLNGYRVNRKAGWDTHGLPVELGVEKELGITKEDIGSKISIEEYNSACRTAVMKYTDVWNDLTEKMGYWVDMEHPYVTYENKYIESVWWLLGQIYDKGLMYKGYTIQPYSPKAGTGLSSHELNQPGCYRDVKDTTVVAQFKSKPNNILPDGTFFLAWTTTPWTLPSNTALCVGPKIEYVLVETFNQYTFEKMHVVLAKNLVGKQLSGKYVLEDEENTLESYSADSKKIPYRIINDIVGSDLVGIEYEQLLPYALPAENPEKAFRVIQGEFVTTEDGTGIVHIAPTFGADDAQVAKEAGVPPMLVKDEHENLVPLVDLQGKFRPEMGEFAGKYVKNEYYDGGEEPERSADVEISIKLKEENRAFKVEKYEHSYPHCWRTDKPVLYYPLDSWFIKVTDVKQKMFELNKTINWKPESTGTGRFGNWLENANDWNLSRSRFWGIPIPIWRTEDGKEAKCISSVEQLKNECQKAVEAGLMSSNPLEKFEVGNMTEENYNVFDLHKNYVDAIVLVSNSGQPMRRESDLIDVWFDSGSMPIAQHHYPFENKELIDDRGFGQADFIAEGVDQTRGWFYTLHAIATMVFSRTAYKNVISNGLVLDKNGHKMSKRLGNAVDPFETLSKYGPDATRWYMITNAQPWDNLKFDEEGILEVQRKFFGTLYNTYNGFLAVYANIDGFNYSEPEVPFSDRPEIDRWVLSRLNSVIKEVQNAYESFEPTRAGRIIQNFVNDELSNWYVRLCRRRFWRGDYTQDKISAYQTLYTCLEKVAILASPIAPFFMDRLFVDLNSVTGRYKWDSVHLVDFPIADETQINEELEYKMDIAQRSSSLVLSLRKREKIKVRQPLQKMMIPALDEKLVDAIHEVKELVLSEVNVKELEIIDESNEMLTKKIKPNFKTIGKKYGKQMKAIISLTNEFSQADIAEVERSQGWKGLVDGEEIVLDLEDFEIATQDIPGWLVANDSELTVALDVTLSDELKEEGIAREFVNRIQNLRKDSGLEVTDRILLTIKSDEKINKAINNNLAYICSETLADNLILADELSGNKTLVEIDADIKSEIELMKAN
ncbi:MAG: isoleucine--tRNA ligase [Flavobacteriales bacterium]|nr:isoleucine--tRNA ligase [Flavobacteriales bacterium]MCB9198450.1 isoleucine--tRNA ligase [Flavobacteriales bacterium]